MAGDTVNAIASGQQEMSCLLAHLCGLLVEELKEKLRKKEEQAEPEQR